MDKYQVLPLTAYALALHVSVPLMIQSGRNVGRPWALVMSPFSTISSSICKARQAKSLRPILTQTSPTKTIYSRSQSPQIPHSHPSLASSSHSLSVDRASQPLFVSRGQITPSPLPLSFSRCTTPAAVGVLILIPTICNGSFRLQSIVSFRCSRWKR